MRNFFLLNYKSRFDAVRSQVYQLYYAGLLCPSQVEKIRASHGVLSVILKTL